MILNGYVIPKLKLNYILIIPLFMVRSNHDNSGFFIPPIQGKKNNVGLLESVKIFRYSCFLFSSVIPAKDHPLKNYNAFMYMIIHVFSCPLDCMSQQQNLPLSLSLVVFGFF